ncbi:replication initiation and membrane attachment family protein [Sporolactobacillus putidus]|uniref:Replication initiation and membrane attachment protein n=1 Tax=Sporolactobacillus putidus TaxID=492735 RepID=A0A917RW98_9BACL|nr:DnaD domain protein [Sporolactobacillus putidus]GGL41989.1 replication initiation and membrane attachment protein [Sporolactobacillus putidus]
MLQSWREVLPGDHYTVRADGLLHYYDQKIMTQLYQPLVGIESTSLYFTLWQETEHGQSGQAATHHHLMGMMNLSLDRILKARKKLEAVGLLRTLKKKDSDPVFFMYLLVPPLTPNQFFNDGLLNVFLYHQVGSRDYNRLSKRFLEKPLDAENFEDLSAAFDEVFESIPASEFSRDLEGRGRWEDHAHPQKLRFQNHFDFSQLKSYLSDAIISEDALTDKVRGAIEKLACVYQTDPFDMSRAVESASLHTGTVDIEMLRKEVRDYYRLEHGPNEMPALYERTQPAEASEMAGKVPQNEEEQLISWYETNSPYQLLEELGHGSKPAAPDLRLVENLMFDTKLNPGVINVLIDYISKVNDNNLNKSFVEKVAAQWSRENVRTVREAMSVARDEKKKYTQQKQRAGTKEAAGRKKQGRVRSEVVPEWMKEQNRADGKHQTGVTEEEAKKRAKWLEDYLNSI